MTDKMRKILIADDDREVRMVLYEALIRQGHAVTVAENGMMALDIFEKNPADLVISDINMPLTEHARRYLIQEGLRADTVIKVGSPMKEILNHYMPKIRRSDVLKRLRLAKGKYFVLSAHREENIDSDVNFKDLMDSLNAIARRYRWPIIVSTHPRTRKRLEAVNKRRIDPLIRFMKPLGLFDYVQLQMNAACVVSDSGTITEESSLLAFPAVTIRQTHERPEGMDEGTLIMCGLKSDRVVHAIDTVMSQHARQSRKPRVIPDHDVDDVSKKVTRIVLSYIDYVNRLVWQKACAPRRIRTWGTDGSGSWS